MKILGKAEEYKARHLWPVFCGERGISAENMLPNTRESMTTFSDQLKTVPNSLLTPPASSDGSSYSPQSSLGSAFSAPTSTPEILKTPVSLISPSPPSPVQVKAL